MINIVALTGRLTYEPELKSVGSGVSVIRFQLAVDRNYQGKGEERKADFIDCVAWRHTAEFISKYFHKGDMIGVQGEIQTDNYTDKDGNNRKQTEVVVTNASFCGGKASGGTSTSSTSTTTSNENADFEGEVDEDSLPF